MAPKTEAELALQRKYEELRKKKEAKLKAKEQQEGKAEQPKKAAAAAPAAAGAQRASSAAGPLGLPAKKAAAQDSRAPATAKAKPVAPTAPEVPGETAKERAIRLLAAKRAAAGGGSATPSAASAAVRRPAGAAAAAAPAAARQPTNPKMTHAARTASGARGSAARDSPADRSSGDAGRAADAAPHSQQDVRQRAIAAQQAARQQQGGGGVDAGPNRPALKRPTSHRPAPPRDADAAVAKRPRADGDARGGDSARFEPREDQGAHRPRDGWSGDRAQERGQDQGEAADEGRKCTLFVGDLPPHYDSQAVHNVFAELAPVESARVVGTQCYAFVRFASPDAATAVIERHKVAPLEVEGGRQLRVNWAAGQLPEWKQGSQMAKPVPGAGPLLEQYEHPKVREARLAAQAAADAFDPEALAEVELRPPPRRALVVYDDL